VIILGDRPPEVVGLLGYAGAHGHVVADVAELGRLPPFEKAIIVAQTTQTRSSTPRSRHGRPAPPALQDL
jgi:4-hydroxy-3-methylbut-2-enyl diphosphate reductase IspH